MIKWSLALFLLLTACISNPAYPPGWPDFSADGYNDCPNLSGIYSDVAHDTFHVIYVIRSSINVFIVLVCTNLFNISIRLEFW
jgi:hypothetical protein